MTATCPSARAARKPLTVSTGAPGGDEARRRLSDGGADRKLGQFVGRGRARIEHRDGSPAAHHRDPVGERGHLAKLVGDQHDGGATGGERPHRGEKAHSLLVGEDRRRLVEDEDAGARQQHLDDLDPLLLRNRQLVDAAAGIDRKAELGGLGRDLSLDLAKTRCETPAPIGEQHVFGDGERPHQLELLVHHSDAASHRIARAGEHDLFAVNEEPPGVRA